MAVLNRFRLKPREDDMNRLRAVKAAMMSAAFLMATFLMGSAVGQSAKTAKEQFVGSWTLVSLTAGEGADQTLPYGPNPKGTMMVDANGRFSITVLRSDLPKLASNNRMTGTADENKAQSGAGGPRLPRARRALARTIRTARALRAISSPASRRGRAAGTPGRPEWS